MKRNEKSILVAVITGLLFTIICLPVYAAGSVSDSDSWKFTLIPYFHLAGMNGEVTIDGITAEVDESFSDLVKNADIGGSFHLEARKGKWGVFIDPMYMKMSADEEVADLKVELEVEQWLVEGGGILRVSEWLFGNNNDRKASIDALAGVRYFSLTTDMDFNLLPDLDWSKDWVDPFVGVIFKTDLSRKISLALRGDIGGFGIGGASDFVWGASVQLGYDVSKKSTLWFGYRVLDFDYDDGTGEDLFEWNMATSGFQVGLAYRF
jgi:hypothetical protein